MLKMIAEGFKKVWCVVQLSKALCSPELDFHREWCWTFTGNAELSSGWELRTQQELKNLKEHRTDTEAAGKCWKIHFSKKHKDTLETHRVLQIPSMNK